MDLVNKNLSEKIKQTIDTKSLSYSKEVKLWKNIFKEIIPNLKR